MNARHRNQKRGFTLVEVLVVLALTTVLMGLLFGPIFRSFELTQRGQAMTDLQDTARLSLEQMGREISDAMYIYDTFTERVGSGSAYLYDMTLPESPDPTKIALEFEDGRATNSYIDLVMPKELLADNGARSPRIQEPLEPEQRIVRYFIGLQDLTNPKYINKFVMPQVQGNNNLYVLYRWEFNPFDKNDPAYDPNNDKGPLADWRRPDWIYKVAKKVSDPKNDLRISVVIPADRYDLMRARKIETAPGAYTIRLSPGVRFLPTLVEKEALSATASSAAHPEAGKTRTPTTYVARYGSWTGSDTTPAVLKGDPHIVVYDNSGSTPTKVFDSSQATNTERSLRWDNQRGVVDFAAAKVSGTINVSTGTYSYAIPGLAAGDHPVPGSFDLQLTYTPSGSTTSTTEAFREVPDPPTAYSGSVFSVDYTNNTIQFAEVPDTGTVKVSYRVQNNKPNDSVYVSYQTTSMITINLVLRKYGPNSQPVGIQLTTKVKPRNLFR